MSNVRGGVQCCLGSTFVGGDTNTPVVILAAVSVFSNLAYLLLSAGLYAFSNLMGNELLRHIDALRALSRFPFKL